MASLNVPCRFVWRWTPRNQGREDSIDPSIEVVHGRIIAKDQIYVICAIEPIRDLTNGFFFRATLPKRQSRSYSISRYLDGAGNSQSSRSRCSFSRSRESDYAVIPI